MNPDGTDFKVLRSFDGTSDGLYPDSGLILFNGALYGTTRTGGTRFAGNLFRASVSEGQLVNFENFPFMSNVTGMNPGPLVAVGGKIYGAANLGGFNGVGTLFEFDPETQILSTLYDFASQAKHPSTRLVYFQGGLYGGSDDGSLFKWDLNSPDFTVIPNPKPNTQVSMPFSLQGTLYGIGIDINQDPPASLFKVNPTGGDGPLVLPIKSIGHEISVEQNVVFGVPDPTGAENLIFRYVPGDQPVNFSLGR
jgi:uncharacterized repeat protein (TIGR03803 family)